MERWSDDKLLLPRDLIYKGKDFSKSFVTDFHITGRKPVSKKASQNLDDTVGDYNFDNPNDTRYGHFIICPLTFLWDPGSRCYQSQRAIFKFSGLFVP